MFPLRDHEAPSRFGFLTYSLIGINILAFLAQLAAPDPHAFIMSWAVTPSALSLGNPGAWITLVTSQFLHGGFLHIAGNMWYLHIFGDNVEDRVGRLGYLALYLSAGVAAALAQVAVEPNSTIPMLGASGAIAGVLGAYLALFPKNRIDTIVPYGLGVWGRSTLPAALVLGFWFVLQLFNGTASVVGGQAGMGGVAFWAHAGGFAYGWIVGKLLARGGPPEAIRIGGLRRPW